MAVRARRSFGRRLARSGRRLWTAAAVPCLAVVASALLWPTVAWASHPSGTGSGRSTVKLSVLGKVPVANLSFAPVEEPATVSPLVLFTASDLVGIDLTTGKEVWDTPVGPDTVDGGGATVTKGLVFEWSSSYSLGPLVALDLTTGRERWTTKPAFVSPEFSPGVVAAGRALATIGSRGLEGLDDANGTLRWALGEIHAQQPGFPIASDGKRVFVTTQPLSGTSWALAAVDAATGRPTWHTASEGSSPATMVVGSQVVAVVTDGFSPGGQELPDRLYAFDARTGRMLWSRNLRESWNAGDPPLIEGGSVIVSTEPAPSPASGNNFITAYRLHTGKVAWQESLQPGAYVTGEGSTVFAEPAGSVVAVDAATGRVLRTLKLPVEAPGPLYASGNRLAIVGGNNVYVLGVNRRAQRTT